MKKGILLTAVVTAFVLGSSTASAQTASDSITVTAANVGIFTFNIVQGSFAFGNVDASGALIAGTGAGVAAGGRNGTNTGGIYNAVGASDWTANSAPPRTVRVFNASTTAVIGWGVADRLGMQVPTTGTPAGSASCGFKAFGTVGDGGAAACGSGNLIRNVTVGNGGSAISAGKLDLRLDVLDTDVAGSNTWTVLLTASGT